MAAVQRQLFLATGARAGRQPHPRLSGLVLHRPAAQAHRAQRRGHRRAATLRPRCRSRSTTRSVSWRRPSTSWPSGCETPSPRSRMSGPRGDSAQRPQRRRHRCLGRGDGDDRQPGRRESCSASACLSGVTSTRPSPPTSATPGENRARHGTTQAVVFVHGERTLRGDHLPVGSGADFTSIVVLRDVTAQAQASSAPGATSIANASHEFKTPLFSLAGFA